MRVLAAIVRLRAENHANVGILFYGQHIISSVGTVSDSLVGVGGWKQGVSESGTGGKTASASHSGESRERGEEKRQSEWTELG